MAETMSPCHSLASGSLRFARIRFATGFAVASFPTHCHYSHYHVGFLLTGGFLACGFLLQVIAIGSPMLRLRSSLPLWELVQIETKKARVIVGHTRFRFVGLSQSTLTNTLFRSVDHCTLSGLNT